ncbi:hypothetical protein Scep_024244 [Stephania cephalantha]|uniref:Uncharacterized protein n=1 Tax=Stephania cephalantha TaxID=152367 RepID=A0AAP0HY81_9MAGN
MEGVDYRRLKDGVVEESNHTCGETSGMYLYIFPMSRMEEQFILRLPPSIAERVDRLLSENASSSEDKSLDLLFSGKHLNEGYSREFSGQKGITLNCQKLLV